MGANLKLIRKVIDSDDISISDKEFDEKFNAVTTLIERGEYDEALPIIESSFKEKTCDIRLTMFYIYLYVHSGGMKHLFEVIPLLQDLMTTHWEKLSPPSKRDQQAEQSIRWFLSRILKSYEKIHQSFKNKNPIPLKSLTAGLEREMISTFNENMSKLHETLLAKWDNPTLGNQLLNVQKKAIDLSQTAVTPEQKKEAPIVEEKNSEPVAEPAIETPHPSDTEKQPIVSYGIPLEALEPSENMKQLYKKLEAFQLLVDKGDYDKAAIIAEDIDKKIEQFNPVDYFPKLFVEYYSQYAKHAGKVGGGIEHTHPTLQKLFQADLATFIDW